MSTLLEKAKAIILTVRQESITEEQEEVAIAWLKGEITTMQITRAIGKQNVSSIAYKLAKWLRSAYVKNKIGIK